MGRRNSSGITSFLSDIVDDIKDFVDDEVIDRGRDTERDLRRAGRNWTDSDSNGDDGGRRSSRTGGGGDLEQVREAIKALTKKIDALETRSGSVSSSGADLPITGYDDLTAAEVNERLGSLSQSALAEVDAYERANSDRVTVTGRIESLRGEQPWADYDEQTVVEIRKELMKANQATQRGVRDYETRHKNRQGVLDAVETSLSSA